MSNLILPMLYQFLHYLPTFDNITNFFFYLNGIYFLLLAIVTVMDKVINEFMHFSISRASNMTEVSPIPGLSLLAEYDDINRCNSVLNDTAAEECNVFFNKMLYYV